MPRRRDFECLFADPQDDADAWPGSQLQAPRSAPSSWKSGPGGPGRPERLLPRPHEPLRGHDIWPDMPALRHASMHSQVAAQSPQLGGSHAPARRAVMAPGLHRKGRAGWLSRTAITDGGCQAGGPQVVRSLLRGSGVGVDAHRVAALVPEEPHRLHQRHCSQVRYGRSRRAGPRERPGYQDRVTATGVSRRRTGTETGSG